MLRVTMFLAACVVLMTAFVLSGCSSATDAPPVEVDAHAGHDHGPGEHDAAEDAGHDEDAQEHAEHAEGSGEKGSAQDVLASLSEEDRAAVAAQKTCPVSGGALGAMGTPVKIAVKDSAGKVHTVFLCCSGCEADLKAEPDKYLAKLKP